jgi:hypothetical protein
MARPKKPQIAPPPLEVPDHTWMDVLKIEHPRQREFLIAYEMCGNVNTASRTIHLNPFDVYKWRDEKHEDSGELTVEAKTFRLALQICDEHRITALEKEARRRAFAGSDILLIFLLKGARPHVYRDNAKIEMSGPDGVPLPGVNVMQLAQGVTAPPISITSPEQLGRVMELAQKYNLVDRLFPKGKSTIDAQAVVKSVEPTSGAST